MPGEVLGTLEEYMPGKGAYEDNGKVLAMTTGVVEYDRTEMMADVVPRTSTPILLVPGQHIIGMITDFRGPIALVTVERVVGEERTISSDTHGSIHISKVSRRYVPEMGRAFKIGDIIRAKIIQIEPSLQLTTIGKKLGTLYSLCSICRALLERHGDDCYCPNCERLWEKKVSVLYRSGVV